MGERLEALARTTPKAKLKRRVRMGRGRTADFPLCEDELYKRFIKRRFVVGKGVDDEWLKKTFRTLLNQMIPKDEKQRKRRDGCSISNGWVWGFKNRYRISNQCKTEKKSHSFAERRKSIKLFHRHIWKLQNLLLPRRDPTWGHFTPFDIYHMDQIPLPFTVNPKRSLNPIGKFCWLRDVGKSGLDKRQATIMLTTRAAGEQDVDCVLIVNGGGKRIDSDEIEYYKGLRNVKVIFQQKAWCDKRVMRWWHNRCWKQDNDRERMLVLDNLKTHLSEPIIKSLTKSRTFPLYPQPNCTDLVAPIDHHVGARLKQRMKKFYGEALEQNWDTWREAENNDSLCAKRRRMLMAGWLEQAWNELREDSDFIRTSFESTGILIKTDMSHKIKMRGGKGYDFKK